MFPIRESVIGSLRPRRSFAALWLPSSSPCCLSPLPLRFNRVYITARCFRRSFHSLRPGLRHVPTGTTHQTNKNQLISLLRPTPVQRYKVLCHQRRSAELSRVRTAGSLRHRLGLQACRFSRRLASHRSCRFFPEQRHLGEALQISCRSLRSRPLRPVHGPRIRLMRRPWPRPLAWGRAGPLLLQRVLMPVLRVASE